MTEDAEHSAESTATRVVPGWEGRLFEDFAPGDVYIHPFGRTVTDVDNQWFTLITQNVARTHVDHHFAAHTDFGRPLVNSTFVLALAVGQSTIDLTMNVYANLGWDKVRMPRPVFVGDTLYARSEVISTRLSQSRPHLGIVEVRTDGYNQDGVIVITFERTFLIYRRGHFPSSSTVRPER